MCKVSFDEAFLRGQSPVVRGISSCCRRQRGLPLSLFPLIRVMLADLQSVQAACASYGALAEVLDMLKQNRLKQDLAPARLQAAITKYLEMWVNAYGPENLPPKGHFINHIPFTLQWRPILACWLHERKHREVKRFANSYTNANSTLAFESAIFWVYWR